MHIAGMINPWVGRHPKGKEPVFMLGSRVGQDRSRGRAPAVPRALWAGGIVATAESGKDRGREALAAATPSRSRSRHGHGHGKALTPEAGVWVVRTHLSGQYCGVLRLDFTGLRPGKAGCDDA